MVLLVPLRRFAAFEVRPIESILTAEFRHRGHGFTAELGLKDEWRDNRTAFRLWRQRLPRCLNCTHGGRMWPIVNKDAYRCRWGHEIDGRDVYRAGRR